MTLTATIRESAGIREAVDIHEAADIQQKVAIHGNADRTGCEEER
ncbi:MULTISPECIES: hypothetical protein [unclassified Streptomyces]|nr:hypothetical protein OG452_32765 [Streptomyces sp. NBC_01197]WSS47525.1 hypothetical protein OG708_02080 [Streptomyces sp. NBC_01180]